MLDHTIPKKIWMVWFQGKDQAPPLVQATIQSWEALNPDWELTVLDNKTLPHYIPGVETFLNNKKIPPQALSDIMRIMLLQRHGGVWTDASVLCTKPLDEWIHENTPDGFFGFERPRYDKLISSWFLVASKNNYIVQQWHDATMKFWSRGFVWPRLLTKIIHKGFSFLIKARLVALIKKPMHLLKRLGMFPYFWFHYLFDELYARDPQFQSMWDRVPKLSADGPHTLCFYGRTEPANEHIHTFINENKVPVHKLAWQIDIHDPALANSCTAELIHTNKQRYHLD